MRLRCVAIILDFVSYTSLSPEEWRDAPDVLKSLIDGPAAGLAWYRLPHNDGFRWVEAAAGRSLASPDDADRVLRPVEAAAAGQVAGYWEAVADAEYADVSDEIDLNMLGWRPSPESIVALAEKKALKARQDKAAGKAYLRTLAETLDVHAANRAARDARLATK